uniref:Uncharacterized protein n=1 Tax=Oryzias latipes TaxID=8090 RepID=H2LNJ5_ORYLA
MAHGIQIDRERFSCPLCLFLFNEPVSLPCGHCYCMQCANKHLDHEEDSGIYSCPECRQEFVSRPLLVRNNILAFVVEEPGDVACDVCCEVKLKAVKSCLQCIASYCEDHLQPHFDVPPLRKHKLVAATAELENSICSKHYEVMKIFCRTDQSCICYLCSKEEHKGHEKVSAAAERNEKQNDLQGSRKRIYSKIKRREKDMMTFQQVEDSINVSVENALAHTENVFTDLCKMIEKNLSVIKEKAISRQKAEVSRFKKLRESVHQEIAELREKDRKLENLSRTDDDISFLLNYSSLAQCEDQPSIRIRHLRQFEKVPAVVLEAKDKILDVLDRECAKIIMTMSGITPDVVETKSVRDRPSQGNQVYLYDLCYSASPQRFAFSWQVLSQESLTGRCYLEVERSGRGVLVAVSYKDISRDGTFRQCMFGDNEKSWALDCFKNSYEFRHNEIRTSIPGTWSSRVGVYVDHDAGLLLFFSISDTMILLHKVQTTFTQPLYAGLWLSDGAAAEVCKLV